MGRHKIIEDDELLAQARAVFVREGINVSSRKIAAEIGVSNSVLFQRFGSKLELMFAAMTPPAPDLPQLREGKTRRVAAAAHLERIALALLDYFRTLVPVLVPLATHPSFDYEAFRKRHPDSPLETLMAELTALLEGKRRRGEIDCADVGALVLNLVAVAHSLAFFERIGAHDGAFDERTVRSLARLLWRGIAPSRRRRAQRPRRSTRA